MGAALAAERPASATSSPSTWAAPASTSASCATAARDQDRLELAVPLLHRPADGRRAERRRRRRFDRARAPGALLVGPETPPAPRPGRCATDGAAIARRSPTPTRCSVTSRPTASRAAHDLDIDGRAAPSSATSPSRSASTWSKPPGASSASSTRTWRTRPAGARRTRCRPRRLALIAYGGNGAVHAWAIARSSASTASRPEDRRRRSPRSVFSSPTTSSTCCAPTSPAVAGRSRRMQALMSELHARNARSSSRPASTGTTRGRPVRADVLPGPELRHERARARRHRARRAGLLDLTERFHDQHEAERGFCFRNQQPSCAACASSPAVHTRTPEHIGAVREAKAARRGRGGVLRARVHGIGFRGRSVYDGSVLGPGVEVQGPALVEEPFTYF